MSKNPKPTTEELRCVYDLILKGYEDADILAEYASLYENGNLMFPYRTDKRFVRERRKELAAAEEVLKEHLKKKINPINIKRKEEHSNHLAEIAGKIWPVNWNIYQGDESNEYDYLVGEYDAGQEVTTEQLCSMLESNLGGAKNQYGIYDVDCFETHLQIEIPEMESKGLDKFIREKPYELIEALIILVQRKIFKGTCPVCKDWQYDR